MGGKLYLVFVTGSLERESYLLFNAKADEFMGAPCISGTYHNMHPKGSAHYLHLTTMHIPLDKVLFVTEYESEESYKIAVERHYANYPKDR